MLRRVPVLEDGIHVRWQKALSVHIYAYAFETERSGGFHGGREGVFFDQDIFTSGGEHPVGHIECGCISYSHAAVPVFIGWMVDDQ